MHDSGQRQDGLIAGRLIAPPLKRQYVPAINFRLRFTIDRATTTLATAVRVDAHTPYVR